MSFTLTSDYSNYFHYDGRSYHVDLAFDNVLKVFELLEDDTFLDYEKVLIALKLLLDKEFGVEDLNEAYPLFKHVFKEYLEIDLDDTTENPDKKKVYDFQKDAELIYASFFSAYNIDLMDAKGELPWNKFIKLLRQLDDKSPFKKAVGYRVMKIPKENKHNKEQVKELKRLKKAYSLEDEAPSKEAIDNKLGAAFSTLKGGGKK